MQKYKILYVKNSSSKLNLNTYNVQAVGLGKAFCDLGYDYDFLFFSNEETVLMDETISEHRFRVFSYKGIRLLRSYYCKRALNSDFLSQYDFIISTEYGQIMTHCFSKKNPNVIMYSGPYYNLFKLPFTSPIYDLLFTKQINKNVKHKFVKSQLAKEYLEGKGYTDLNVIGVALDIERFNTDVPIAPDTRTLADYMTANRCILYVGALSDRKNYPFLLDIYKKVHTLHPDVKFVMIGKGKEDYVSKYYDPLPDDVKAGIYRMERIDNAQLKYIYPLAKAFLLPSKLEIFGMVLLESMYLGAPVVTSWNGGSSTLIDGRETGQIVREFDADKWCDAVGKYLDDEDYSRRVTENARELIETEYVWSVLAEKMLKAVEGDACRKDDERIDEK